MTRSRDNKSGVNCGALPRTFLLLHVWQPCVSATVNTGLGHE